MRHKRFRSFGLRQAQDRLLRDALTKLPQLASVDALLISAAAPTRGEETESLPPIAQEGAGARGANAALHARGRRKSAFHPLDTNGFNACLQLPPLVHELEGEDYPDDRPRRPKEWHVLLLPDRLEDAGDPSWVAATARSVAAELQTTQAAAEQLVETVCEGSPALLATCKVQAEALRKAASLRDRGLSVRVTSRPFAEASSGAFTARMQNFAQLCGGTLRGDLFRLAKNVSRHEAANACAHSVVPDWRRTTDMNLKIAPEDPIEALYELERRLRANRPTNKRTGRRFRTLVAGSVIVGAHPPPAEEQPRTSRDAQGEPRPSGTRSARMTTGRSSPDHWNIAPVKASLPAAKLSPIWREACRLMRTFVFGKAGEEIGDEEDADQESMGSKEEVFVLFGLWARLDRDHSGRVSFEEFRTFCRHHAKTLLGPHGMPEGGLGGADSPEDFAQRLCEKVEKLLLEKKSSFCIEDMMRLLWPTATRQQLKQMKQWTTDFAFTEQRIKIRPPPVLPREELEGLRTMFKQFDKGRRGYLQFADLVELGVIHKYQLERYQQEWDRSGDGRLDLLEFCDMMCPAGYRAHAYAMIGSLQDGRRVLYDQVLQMWRLEDGADELDRGWL